MTTLKEKLGIGITIFGLCFTLNCGMIKGNDIEKAKKEALIKSESTGLFTTVSYYGVDNNKNGEIELIIKETSYFVSPSVGYITKSIDKIEKGDPNFVSEYEDMIKAQQNQNG